jgi:hypothetical protein
MPSPKRRRSSKRPPVDPADCAWLNAKGTIQDFPAYFRLNGSLKERAPCTGFEYEVLVLIYFNSTGDNGLPQSEKDLSAVDDIEDKFKDRLEATGSAILALVITTDGARELYFYSSDPDAAIAEWEEKLQPRMRTHKVEFKIRPDEEWDIYRKFA